MTNLKLGRNDKYNNFGLFLESQTDQINDNSRQFYTRSNYPMKLDNEINDSLLQLGFMNDSEHNLAQRVPVKDFKFHERHFGVNRHAISDEANKIFDIESHLESSLTGIFDNYQLDKGPQIDPIQYQLDLLNQFDRSNQQGSFISNGNYNSNSHLNRKVNASLSEMGAQTDGFMIPLNGPFYIGSQECFISDEKWIEACVHFMHLRSEFLSMLGYSSFSADDENQQYENIYSKKRRKKISSNKGSKLEFMNGQQGFNPDANTFKAPTENLLERDSLDQNSNTFCTSYCDEESRASGVPIIKPLTGNTKSGHFPQYKSLVKKVHLNKSNSSNENLYNMNNFCFKRRSSSNDIAFQSDNGATPGRPRMNRSDFACTLCQTRNTPQWRYLEFEPVCNACYMRARKQQRVINHPSNFTNSKIKINRVPRLNRDKDNTKIESNSDHVSEIVNNMISKEATNSIDN